MPTPTRVSYSPGRYYALYAASPACEDESTFQDEAALQEFVERLQRDFDKEGHRQVA
jgi:hypothetical protein